MSVSLIPEAPTPANSQTEFPGVANTFFASLRAMVGDVNDEISGLGSTDLTELPAIPVAQSTFVGDADTFVASLPGLRTGVNTIIADLSLACDPVTALPATPSRASDPANFATEAAAFLAALPLLRTELNAFIAALGTYVGGEGGFDQTDVTFDSTAFSFDEA